MSSGNYFTPIYIRDTEGRSGGGYKKRSKTLPLLLPRVTNCRFGVVRKSVFKFGVKSNNTLKLVIIGTETSLRMVA